MPVLYRFMSAPPLGRPAHAQWTPLLRSPTSLIGGYIRINDVGFYALLLYLNFNFSIGMSAPVPEPSYVLLTASGMMHGCTWMRRMRGVLPSVQRSGVAAI